MRKNKSESGVALFIVLSSIVILTLGMKELLQNTNQQGDRVRNSMDRIQATYLAKSTVNLARFFLILDQTIESQTQGENASDTLGDLWANPIPFPVPPEVIEAFSSKDNKNTDAAKVAATQGACKEFFDDFQGQGLSRITDLTSRLNLNDLTNEAHKATAETFLNLLSPNIKFIQKLEQRRIDPAQLLKQIRDYADADLEENETKADEASPYNAAELSYASKNRPFTNLDELKLIPEMDDELFDYLSGKVAAVYIANRRQPAKINLNTVSKEVFQSLLKNVSNPDEIARRFIEDRKEKERIYTDKSIPEILKNEFELDAENFQLALATGLSDVFLIETTAEVLSAQIQMESIVLKPTSAKQLKPFVQVRVSP